MAADIVPNEQTRINSSFSRSPAPTQNDDLPQQVIAMYAVAAQMHHRGNTSRTSQQQPSSDQNIPAK